MDFLTSDAFVTIFSVVGSAIGLFLALRADIGKRIGRVEDRLGKRIDRVEDRARADRLEFVAEISRMKTSVSAQIAELTKAVGAQFAELNATVSAQTTELKTAVGILGAKLDERSEPQRLVVQEPRGDYKAGDGPEDEPEDGPEA